LILPKKTVRKTAMKKVKYLSWYGFSMLILFEYILMWDI